MFSSKSVDFGSPFKQRIEYDGSGNPIYIGDAEPATATTAAKWRIKKLTYSGSNVTQIDFAGGNDFFNKIWDSRTTYTYS